MAARQIEKEVAEQMGAMKAETDPMFFRFTAEAFCQAIDANVFDHPERMELKQGIVMESPEQTTHHTYLTDRLSRRLRSALQNRFVVYGRRPLRIDEYNQPCADVLVITGMNAAYRERHPIPENVTLLAEVSDTTVAYDLGGKALLYAQAGITDYWVVLVNEAAIVVYREPAADGYGSVTRLAGTDTISPLAAPEAIWTVAALLGREG